MKKFMIFLLMAFLYLGTSQASNEFTPSSNDVGKSLRHWVSPSVGSSAYAKFKPFSSFAPVESGELVDSIIRVRLVGPTHACPGQVICLTAVVENDYLGGLEYKFRRNGNYELSSGVDPLYPNRIYVTIEDLGGLDSLIQEFDVVVYKGCHQFRSPAHYVHVYSIHAQLDSVLVCNNTDNGLMCANVFSNGAENPYAYVWYDAASNTVKDTTYVPCKSLSVGKYFVEAHFTSSGCVTRSDTAEVKVSNGPADGHITMNDITALTCNGNQVFAKLSGIVSNYGTPSINWSLNGITIPGANDSTLLFSPVAIAGDTTMYILKAEVAYSNYNCKTYTVMDTVRVLSDPTIAIYGNPIVCSADLATGSNFLFARTNGYIDGASYSWSVDGLPITYTGLKDTLDLSKVTGLVARTTPYEIAVSVTGSHGCSAASTAFLLYVNGAPVVHVSKDADTVCTGAMVTLTANLENNNTPNLTYVWYKKVGTGALELIPTATTASYATNVTDSTMYKVVVKQLDSECTSEDSVKVYVFPDAKPVKDLVLNLNDAAICNGAQIALTLVDTANTNQYGEVGTYTWLINGVEVDDAEGKTYTFIPEVTDVDSIIYNIVVNATYTTTCGTIPASVDTTIAVFKRPTVTISGDPIVCNSDTVRLTANIHGVLGTTTYTWRVDGVDSVKDKDFKVKLDERDYQYNISVVVAPNTACETVSEVYPVLIGNNPTVAIGISAPTVCENTEVTLTAHLGDYNMPNLIYQWYSKKYNATGDSIAIAIGTSRDLNILVADSTKFTVVVKQVNSGCFAKGDTVINVFEETPAVKPVLVQASEYNVCYGAQVTFAAIDTANYKLFGSGTYQWSVNGVAVSGATDSIYTFVPATVDNDSINYTVAVRVDYNTTCVNRFAENDTMITVYRNPSVTITGDPIVCDGSALNLTAVVHDTLTAPVSSYLWRVDGVDSTTAATFTSKLDVRDYPYELTVVLNAGTACEVESAPFTVLIGSHPTAALEASDTIVCKGNNVTLTAHLGDYNMPNLTYNWYRKTTGSFDSIPVGTSRVLTIPVDAKTEYFVKITQVNSECVAYSDTLTVNVYNEPAPLTPLILLASDTAICFGGQVSYAVIDSANIKNYGKGTYQWSVNGVDVAGATDSIYIFSPDVVDNDFTAYNIAVAVTYTTPCTILADAIDTVVTVQRNPSVVISGDPVVCQDTIVDLYATVHDTLPGMQVSYLWRVDGVDSIQNTNHFRAKLDQRDYPYEITVVINQGTACESSDVYSVLIGNIPTVAIEVSAPTVCKGEDVTLTAHIGDYNMPNLTYQWYSKVANSAADSLPISIGTSRTLTVPVDTATQFTVVVSQVNSDCFAVADTVINVFPKDPEVEAIELIASAPTVCIGGQIAFYVQDTTNRKNYFGADSIPGAYRWFVNGFELMTVSGDHFMFSPAAFDLDTTNYVIEVEATYQTQCETHVAADADTVTARSNPSVVINGDPMLCDTTEVHLYAIVNDTLPGVEVSYLWRVDGVDSTLKTTNEFITSLPNRDYPYEITVVLNQGSNCEVVSEPFYLYIEDQPEVVVTVDYDTVCKDQVVNLTAHLGNYNQGNLTYQWFADGDSIYYGTESTVAYTITKPAGQTTHFEVIVTQLNSACQGTGYDSVYTFKNPVLDTILVTNLQDDIHDAYSYHQYYQQPAYDVCEGASVQVTAWLRDESGNLYTDSTITYKWRKNGVVIEGVNGYRFMEQLAILDHDQYKYVYTVEIDEPYYPNCYSIPTSVNSDTVKVRRNPVVIIGGEQFVCDRGTGENNVLLNAWVDGAVDTGAIYRWYRDGMFEENPYHAQYGAMFLGSFRARYGYNYTFQVEVINGSGCSSWSEPFEVTVMAPPVINVIPYADTVCTGGEVILVSHLDDYNVVDYELQYQWYTNSISDDNLIPGATEAVYSTNVNQTTDYIVKVGYLAENSNMPACVASDTTRVAVYDRPEIDSIIMSLTEVCEGSQIQLTAVMDSVHQGVPGVPYIYEWYRNSEILPGNAATIYDAPMTADGNEQQYTYSVKVYQNPERMMCESPIYVSSQTLTVYPNPIVAIFGDQHICYTDTIELVANIDTISNPVSTNVHYFWFESGAPIDNINGDSKTLRYYAPAQDEPYRFTVQVERDSSITGCRSYSYEYDVWVYNAPVANVTIVDTAVCEGAEVTVTAHLNQNVPEQTNLEYQWYAKSHATADTFQLIGGATELTYTTTIFETTEFKFEVVHTLSGCFDTDSKTIQVFPIPVVTEVVMSDTNVCEGSDVIITAHIDSTKGIAGYPYFYEWRRNGELLEGNTATIHDQPMTADGTTQTYVYSAIAYQTPERMACVSQLTESAELTVFGDPRVAIFGDQHVCYTDTISLIANVDTFAYPVGDLHFQWYESGNMITNLNGDSKILRYYAPAQDEPYRFTVQIERDNAQAACRMYSTEYDVWVYNAPVANVTIVDTAVCEGAEVTVTAHLNQNVPEQLNLEYQWYAKSHATADTFQLIGGATELTYTTTIFETTEFKFEVVHTLSGCFDTDSKTIQVFPIPVVTEVVMSDTNVCEGSDVIITAHIDSTKGIAGYPYFYEWRRNGELLEGNTATIHDVPMTADGTTQTYVYSAIAYQTPERMACVSQLTESAELTVFGNPRVAIFGDQHVCYTDTISLVANVDTFAYPVGDLHFQWYESGNMITNLNGDSKTLRYYAPAQDEPYRFTVQIERDNSEAGCRSYSTEYDVWVYNAPVANVTIVDEDVCEGAEVTVTAHLNQNVPEQTNLEYQWFTKTANDTAFVLVPGATELTYTTSIFVTTEFKFEVVHTLSGCFDTDSKTINVHPIPVVNYVSMSDTNVCEGAQVAIYADVDTTKGVAGQPYYFEWRRNGEPLAGNTQTIFDSPMTVDGNEQTFVYSVIAYQTPERLACYSELVESATLNVYPNPRVVISGDQYVCETDSVFLYASVDTIGRPVGILHYTWYESGRLRDNMAYGLADSRYFSEYFYAQDEPYRFTVEVQRDNIAGGCRAYSEEFLVWVFPQPVVNITASETEVCVGGEVTLRANLNNYEFNYANDSQYQWYTIDTVEDSRHIGIDSTTGDYIDSTFIIIERNPIPGATTLFFNTVMTHTQSFGFTATHNLSGCSDYDEITITVNDIPVIVSVENLSGEDTLCPGGRVELHATVEGGVPGGEVYTWYRNGVALESTGENLIDYPLAVDNNVTMYIYEVVVKQTAAGCESVIDSLSTDTIWVVPNPTIELSGDPIVCDTTAQNIVITANVVSYVDTTGYEYTYQWYENNAPIEGETGLVLSMHKPYRDYPYSFNFEVKNPYGCTVLSEPFLVYVNDNPIVHIAADDTLICENGTVTLTADLYDQNAQNLVYVWYINGDSIPGAYNTTYTTTLTTTSTFTYKAYQRDSHCAAISNEVTVHVVPAPVVDNITVVSVDTAICEGHVVTLHANISGGDTTDTPVFTWYKDNEVVEGVTGETFTDYPMSVDNEITTHVYNVTVAQSSSACFSLYDVNDEVNITVRPNPRYTIYGDADVCESETGNNIVLNGITNDSIIATAADYTYTWYESGVEIVGQNTATLSINKPYRTEPYIFKLVVTDNQFGCTAETEDFLVYVSARPIVNVTSTEDTICTNGVVTLTANIYDQNAEYLAFQWYKNDTTAANKIMGANDATYTTAVETTTEFIVVVDQLTTGCQTVASTTVKVNDIPVIASVENLSGQDTLCPGGRVELHATISGGVAGGEVYTWYRNGVQLESTGENLIDYPAAEDNNVAQYIYEVTVRQNAAACQSVITAASTDTLWIVPNPTIELAGDPIVCEAAAGVDNITINANVVSYLETPYTYQWYENNAPIVGETGLTLTIHKDYRDYPYSFNFAVQNIYGCTVESEPFLVYVNDNPVVNIAADDTLICENGTVTLTADLYDQNADNMVYVWYMNGDSIPGAYNTTYTTTLATTATFTFKAFQRDSHCEAISNAVTVNVVAAPVVNNITVVSVDTAICEGHVVSLHANVTGGDNVDEYVYTWYKDNEIVEGATGADYTDYPMSVDNDLTTHIYNVTVAQASSACFSLYDNATEVEITVRPNPRYTIYGDADVCEESDITIANITLVGITTDNVIGTTGDYTFTWYESGVEIVGQNTTTLAINEPYRHEPYLFKLVVTDNVYGCSFETEEFAVTVGQKPVVVIAVDQDSICEGGNVTLTSTLMNQTEEGIIYQWQKDVNGTWTNIEGAIAPVYVTPALTETTTFRLHVTNTFNGCEANSINDITVTVKPTPVIDIVNVTANVVCNGGEVTLTATGADQYTGLGDIQYQWYNNGQAIFGADQNVYTTSPLTVDGDMTTYTFGVQVIMSNSGCVSNIDTATVTVYADPTVTITYDNGLTLCEGGVTTLTANPNHAYFTDFTYQWYLHGQPINGANNATYVVENLTASANAYDYTVEITVNNGTQNGCSAMAEPVYVTIVNDPTAYITVNEGLNAICEGGTVTFTVNVNDGVADTYNPYTYAWYSNVAGNGVVLGTEASFTTSADDAANLYVYYVDVTSAYGCNVQASDTLRIVADPTVTIAVKLGEDTVVCDGGHTTLIATVEGGLGDATYQWYKNGFAIAGANGNEYVTDALLVNETAAYTVSVSQTGIACTATSTQFNVAVYDAIEVALSANSEVNCVGGTVTLTATTTNGIPGDVLTYQWFRNGNPINGANGAQYVTDENLVAGHYEYQVEVASTVSGCHVAMSSTIGITVEAEPTVMISSNVDGNAICEGGDITLTANVIYATNATNRTNTYTYTWKWYEGTTLRSVTTSEPHYTLPTTLTAGSYNFFVEISSNDGLGCDASSQANLFNVVVKPVPSVILTASADESCQGGDVTLNAVVIPSNLSGIFYWNVNGQQIVSSEASITVNNMAIGTNNISVVFAPNDAQVACQSAATTITHVVNAAPVVTVAATDASRLSMCVGGTITIAATATGTANSSDHYVWTVDGQIQTGNTGSTFTTQFNNAGIHFISALVERANGCNSEYSTPVAVTVAEQPTAQLTQIAGFTEMCAGGEITLMAKVANYSTVNNGVTNSSVHNTYTYTWYRDNAEFMTSANVTVDNAQITETLNTPAAYTYSVTITASGYNCQAAHATLDHQIRVVPDPSWSVNQVNPSELCIGGIVTLNAEVTGGVENQQAGRIQWYKTFNGVESEVPGLGGVNTDVPQAAGVYTYAPKYIDYIGAGCNIADATATQVTVNDLPTATFTSGQGSVICGHDYQSFATLNISLTGTAPFTFTIMNMTTGEQQTIVTSLSVYPYNVSPDVTSIYRIISVSDANGCIGTMDNVADAVVSVSDVQIEDQVVVASCGDYVARIRLQINASTSTTAIATLPDGSTQTVNIMFDAYTQQHYVDVQMPAVAGDYMVNIEVEGCSGDVLVRVPADDVTMGVSTTLVDQRWDDVLVVNNNPDNNGGYRFSTYQWYKNGEMIEGATGQIYQEVGGLGGEYSVELDGVRVSDSTHVHFVTCGKYFDANSSIRVYPVPANTAQEVTVELNMTDEELNGAILDIYDVRGAHVKTVSNLTHITKVGNFGAQGTYFGRIITGTNEIKTVKFIIVK